MINLELNWRVKMNIGVKNFIEENIELLDREDYQEFDARAGMQTSDNGYSKGELYEVLLRSGINPLPYLLTDLVLHQQR